MTSATTELVTKTSLTRLKTPYREDTKIPVEYEVHGFVAKGYEPIKEIFDHNFELGLEECAQLCIYVKGKKVVDLYGAEKIPDDQSNGLKYNYSGDSIQNIFSSSKAVTSLVIAMLVDRGHLKYDQLVTDVYPEYGDCNKHKTTIAQIMRHEAGLSTFSCRFPLDNLSPERIKSGAMSKLIAAEMPHHTPGDERSYHSISRGFLLNEIVYRVDPQHRTIGEFLRDEICIPLGLEKELYIGLPESEHHRVAPIVRATDEERRRELWENPKRIPKVHLLAGAMIAYGPPMKRRMSDFFGYTVPHPFETTEKEITFDDDEWSIRTQFWNQKSVRKSEIPSANGHGSAKALAILASCLCQNGVFVREDGTEVRLLSENGLKEAHGNPDTKKMFFTDFTFNNAGWCEFKEMREGYTGWMGYGGSVFQWNKEHEIALGYTMNLLEPVPLNTKGFEFQKKVKRLVIKLESEFGDHSADWEFGK